MHSSSITLPLGAARYLTPLFLARCTLSGKGKKASLEQATPSSLLAHSFFSSSWIASTDPSNKLSHCSFSPPSRGSPLTNKSIALAFSARLTPFLKGKARTLGWWRSHQRSALPPARRVQWMRDCWPAPIPMIDPWKAYETLLDWVYFRAKVATIRSITAADGSYGAPESGIGFK